MRILMATAMGLGSAGAGFSAGLVGTILVSPLTGTTYPAVTIGVAMALMAMFSTFVVTLRLAPIHRP